MFANLAATPGGGPLYTAWANTMELLGDAEWGVQGIQRGVFLSRSDDDGISWSDPLPVATKRPGEVRRPAIAVSSDGVVAVAWMEEDPAAGCFEPLVAISTDAGQSFSEPARLASTARCTSARTKGNVRGEFDVSSHWPAGGDYFGLASGTSGQFFAVWADGRTGVFQLWGATIRTR